MKNIKMSIPLFFLSISLAVSIGYFTESKELKIIDSSELVSTAKPWSSFKLEIAKKRNYGGTFTFFTPVFCIKKQSIMNFSPFISVIDLHADCAIWNLFNDFVPTREDMGLKTIKIFKAENYFIIPLSGYQKLSFLKLDKKSFSKFTLDLPIKGTFIDAQTFIGPEKKLRVFYCATAIQPYVPNIKVAGLIDVNRKKQLHNIDLGIQIVYAYNLLDKNSKEPLILTGTYSGMNATYGTSTTDFFRAYVFIFDTLGNKKFFKAYWGAYLKVVPFIINLKREKKIFVFGEGHYFRQYGFIEKLDAESFNVERSVYFKSAIYSPVFVDLDRDGDIEIVIGTADGRLISVTKDLRVLQEIRIPPKSHDVDYLEVYPLQAFDMDNDGKVECFVRVLEEKLIARTPKGTHRKFLLRFIILDDDFRIRFERNIEDDGFGLIFDANDDGVNELVIGDKNGNLEIWEESNGKTTYTYSR